MELGFWWFDGRQRGLNECESESSSCFNLLCVFGFGGFIVISCYYLLVSVRCFLHGLAVLCWREVTD